MARIVFLLRSLGNAGAVANVERARLERREAELRVEALARRLAPSTAAPLAPRAPVELAG